VARIGKSVTLGHVESAIDQATNLEQALKNARQRLLDARNAAGHWEGHLSSSALSTATAIFALSHYARHHRDAARLPPLIAAGIAWLVKTQNPDGGWGDTTLSFSNISTTALCWAALTIGGEGTDTAAQNAEAWLTRAAGSLDPDALARAIAARYGKDRTFSVPILTLCAMAGRLGPSPGAWRRITQLPFELAALPQSWFRFVRLPVVSYALPALIAMGLARHHNRPSRNPITRLLRGISKRRVLRVLTSIQPSSGGFLEATPLTSFVVMSLIAAGYADHAVVQAGVDFLVRSARPDGSWPIDTNLATWVTTLSINALGEDGLQANDRRAVRDWLLGQQYKVRHPYTGAAPGAWAWTDLPGGVPDADDTAGALLALHQLGDVDERVLAAAENGVRWLLALQNSDGGIPTFCRGWTNLPFDRSGADLTAHALRAWTAWRNQLSSRLVASINKSTSNAIAYLKSHKRPDGSWTPLWFGNQSAPDEENATYGTARVLQAIADLADPMVERGKQWLLRAQNPDGGWGGSVGAPSSIEETALALQALETVGAPSDALNRGCAWLLARTAGGTVYPASPIGFYFAKLWYYEEAYPLIWTVAALNALHSRQ
jgi:squalene-hopene/tetraprenyl-beta-curcumene cyclase